MAGSLPNTATYRLPIEHALLVLDSKWSTLIIRELLGGRQFGELRKRLDIGSPKTLTERLRILEHQGVLTHTVHAEVPPRVVYELTERGRGLLRARRWRRGERRSPPRRRGGVKASPMTMSRREFAQCSAAGLVLLGIGARAGRPATCRRQPGARKRCAAGCCARQRRL